MQNNLLTTRLGDTGKKLVRDYFLRKGYTVSPCTTGEHFVDFLASSKTQTKKILVRTDTYMYTTGNIFLERFMNRADIADVEEGWFFSDNPDMLAYLDAFGGNLYFFDWKKLKQHAIRHYRATIFNNSIDNATEGDGYLIPIRELMKSDAFRCHTKINVLPLACMIPNKPNPF